ncbi:YgfZ/GcvT domain-containing protein [Candidatus Thiosymbion oneisti]|uniref:CAF17-like 4Fe-4S cluster assembly/insertion protein YgfZ n=1 Tax=Candidatus Thiosymbion oneisti TaxID=589554 RepID=UPI000A79E784|nr:folate-binding protein YgfZ [Candidatus Thiosymbion oneisti]
MNSVWKTFLESHSARIDDAGKVRFPDAPVEADCALMALSPLGLIAVSGPEAESFLQGQVTHDVTRLSTAVSQLGSHCSPKGRMLASFRTFRRDAVIYLQLPRTQVEALTRRLHMYLLRAKATIEDASERLIAIAIAGTCAPSLLASHLAAVPTQENGVTQDGELITIRIPGPTPRFQLLGPPAALEAIWDDLAATATVVNTEFWSLLDIRSGIPTLYRQTSDAFVPQMANLHLLDGVSFKKGCYTGQEVVARMQYLGKLKRRMYLAQVSTDDPPVPGDVLHAANSRSEQAAGRVVDAGINGKGDYELLAVVEIEAAERGEVRLGGPDGPSLSFRDLPYGFSGQD